MPRPLSAFLISTSAILLLTRLFLKLSSTPPKSVFRMLERERESVPKMVTRAKLSAAQADDLIRPAEPASTTAPVQPGFAISSSAPTTGFGGMPVIPGMYPSHSSHPLDFIPTPDTSRNSTRKCTTLNSLLRRMTRSKSSIHAPSGKKSCILYDSGCLEYADCLLVIVLLRLLLMFTLRRRRSSTSSSFFTTRSRDTSRFTESFWLVSTSLAGCGNIY